MIIAESLSEPMFLSVNNQPPKNYRQRLITYKIETDEDMKEFTEVMGKGRDIITQIVFNNHSYMMIREMIPMKIEPIIKAIEK